MSPLECRRRTRRPRTSRQHRQPVRVLRHRATRRPERRPRPASPPRLDCQALQPRAQGLGGAEFTKNSPLRPARTQGPHDPLEGQRPARRVRRCETLPAFAALHRAQRSALSVARRTPRGSIAAGVCRGLPRDLENPRRQVAQDPRLARDRLTADIFRNCERP